MVAYYASTLVCPNRERSTTRARIPVDVGINIRTQILDQVSVIPREGNGIDPETSSRAVGPHIQSVAQSSGIQGLPILPVGSRIERRRPEELRIRHEEVR